ncbi:hypothetical protein S7335_1560 [Synechococcus sp. PCC 7335]|uniref:hypothetical protein n=1 Tax=Synechococcus sp. (strain ATCC 29403 / PCC 7335) TaxID=91464 RepID=UPI00017EB4A6|nr:hypothetical protein [Synechococcus sp. PCC 7335]EDX83863.1 hypothetical protein S7335_1560 [Synechococcus sp. PCC 7335]
MDINLNDDVIKIQLEPIERLWSFHISQWIEVPLSHVQSIRLERPRTSWQELRAPGTYVPGLIKAGTYYTERGREFWYVQGEQSCLCLDITDGYYKRIVLASPRADRWRSQIQSAIATQPNA